MSALPVLHSTNMAPVAVQFEANLAGFGVVAKTFQEGTTIWCRETRKLYTWDPQSTAGTVSGVSVAVSTGGAFIATGGPSAIPSLDVLAFGADPTGVADSTTAFNATLTAANALLTAGASGADVALPRGNFKITGNVLVSKSRIRIYGQGVGATTINFAPTVAGTSCFTISGGALELFRNTIENLSIISVNGTRKVAITLIDTSEAEVSNIEALFFVTAGWAALGDSSIGLRLQGRELTKVKKCTFNADRPLSIENNPNSALSCDHLTMTDVFLNAGTNSDSCIQVSNPIDQVSNWVIEGTNPWVGGKNGLLWAGGVAAIRSLNIKISGVRWEQQVGAAGFCFDVNRNIANFALDDIAAGTNSNGFKFRNIEALSFRNCTYEGVLIAKDLDNTSRSIFIVNCFWQNAATNNLGTLVDVLSMRGNGTGVSAPAVQFLDAPASADLRINVAGVEGNPVEVWSNPAAGGHKLLKVIDFGGAGTRTQLDSNGLDFQLLGPAGSNIFFSSTGICQLTGASVVSSVEMITAGFIGVEQGNPTGSGIVSALNTRTPLTLARMPANTGDGVTYVANATTVPTASATGGGILYATAGALTYRGSGGTVTTLGAA